MKALNEKELKNIDAYFRAANYLSVAQLYLKDNPLLRERLTLDHIKPNVVGHWGTAPGQNFIYVRYFGNSLFIKELLKTSIIYWQNKPLFV